jgi:methionyl-tRNA formyltransferase
MPDDPNDPGFTAQLGGLRLEVAVLAAYGFILKPDTLVVPKHGFINVHPSLLPRYRGAAPIQRAIMAGEERSGVTVIQLSRAVDAGDIIVQESVDIGPDETAGELTARLAVLGANLLLDVLARLAQGPLPRIVQNPEEATFAPKLTKKDRRLKWHEPAASVHNRIRGMAPAPGAVCLFRGRRLILLGSRRLGGEHVGRPGEVLLDRPGLAVATGEGAIELTLLKPEGSRVQTGAEFRRGHRPAAGERLEEL